VKKHHLIGIAVGLILLAAFYYKGLPFVKAYLYSNGIGTPGVSPSSASTVGTGGNE